MPDLHQADYCLISESRTSHGHIVNRAEDIGAWRRYTWYINLGVLVTPGKSVILILEISRLGKSW